MPAETTGRLMLACLIGGFGCGLNFGLAVALMIVTKTYVAAAEGLLAAACLSAPCVFWLRRRLANG